MANLTPYQQYRSMAWTSEHDKCEWGCGTIMREGMYYEGDLGHYCSESCRDASEGSGGDTWRDDFHSDWGMNSSVITYIEVPSKNRTLVYNSTEWPGADLRGANLLDADLRFANLRGADLRGANLRGADLRSADLRDADLRAANLRFANLRGADLRGVDLCSVNLRGANLQRANLYGANLQGVDLYVANLLDADLRGADLRGANLGGSDLCSANLRFANLRGAKLRGADLRGADLCGVNLLRTDLAHAKLYGAYLSGTCLDPTVFPRRPLESEIIEAGLELIGGRVYGYRTARSMHCGNTDYTMPGEYIASALSIDESSSCHPGIYLASRAWLKKCIGGDLVRCWAHWHELVHAGDKWRAKRIVVIKDVS